MCVGLTCVCSMVTYVFVHEWLYNHSTNIHKFRNKRGRGDCASWFSFMQKNVVSSRHTSAFLFMRHAESSCCIIRPPPQSWNQSLKISTLGEKEEADLNLNFAIFTPIFSRMFKNDFIGSRQDLLGRICNDIYQYIDIFLNTASPSRARWYRRWPVTFSK